MKTVCKRFLDLVMTPEQVAERMDVPMKFVKACIKRNHAERLDYKKLF